MGVITNMNDPMKMLMRRKTIRHMKKEESLSVYAEIKHYISQVRIQTKGDERWLSPPNGMFSADISEYQTLTDYEWDAHEVYFENELVKRRYKLYIKDIQKAAKEAVQLYLPQIPVCMIVTVQKGKYSNINVRFHIYRKGEFHIEKNLACYKQPVLYEIYNCETAD